jgi:acetolactate synthase-1/2/3 large subunit
MTGGEAAAHTLRHLGVEVVFGVTGAASNWLVDGLGTSGSGIVFMNTIHEQNAGHTAEAIGRLTGEPGIACSSSGPGATNLVTALYTAHKDAIPMLALTGNIATHLRGKNSFQDLDVHRLYNEGLGLKYSRYITDPNEIPAALLAAFRASKEGRPGPVAIDIPEDISGAPYTGNLAGELRSRWQNPNTRPPIDEAAIIATADALDQAERPIIMIGRSATHAANPILELARLGGIPVVYTLPAQGTFPDSDPLNQGMFGKEGTKLANEAVDQADAIIGIGLTFDNRAVPDPQKLRDGTRFIAHINIDPDEMGKIIDPDQGIVADSLDSMKALLDEMKLRRRRGNDYQAWRDYLEDYRQRYETLPTDDTIGLLTGPRVIAAMHHLTAGKALITADVGNHQIAAAKHYKSDLPGHRYMSGGAGTMGTALPYAMASKLLNPDKTTIAFIGDGGF